MCSLFCTGSTYSYMVYVWLTCNYSRAVLLKPSAMKNLLKDFVNLLKKFPILRKPELMQKHNKNIRLLRMFLKAHPILMLLLWTGPSL